MKAFFTNRRPEFLCPLNILNLSLSHRSVLTNDPTARLIRAVGCFVQTSRLLFFLSLNDYGEILQQSVTFKAEGSCLL